MSGKTLTLKPKFDIVEGSTRPKRQPTGYWVTKDGYDIPISSNVEENGRQLWKYLKRSK